MIQDKKNPILINRGINSLVCYAFYLPLFYSISKVKHTIVLYFIYKLHQVRPEKSITGTKKKHAVFGIHDVLLFSH